MLRKLSSWSKRTCFFFNKNFMLFKRNECFYAFSTKSKPGVTGVVPICYTATPEKSDIEGLEVIIWSILTSNGLIIFLCLQLKDGITTFKCGFSRGRVWHMFCNIIETFTYRCPNSSRISTIVLIDCNLLFREVLLKSCTHVVFIVRPQKWIFSMFLRLLWSKFFIRKGICSQKS